MSALLLIKIVAAGLLVIIAFVIISWVELYTQIGRYRNYWDKNNAKPAQPGELLYVALGDSTAQGIGATSPAKGYVGLIAKQLEEDRNQPVRTVNLSKTGAKARDVIDRQLPELQKIDTDSKTVITMEIGANDIVDFESARFEKEMDEVFSKMPKQSVISDIPYFGGSRFKSREAQVSEANQILYKLAKKHNFKLVSIHERIQQNSSRRILAVDFFHPSNIAYKEIWTPAFMEKL